MNWTSPEQQPPPSLPTTTTAAARSDDDACLAGGSLRLSLCSRRCLTLLGFTSTAAASLCWRSHQPPLPHSVGVHINRCCLTLWEFTSTMAEQSGNRHSLAFSFWAQTLGPNPGPKPWAQTLGPARFVWRDSSNRNTPQFAA